MRSPGATILSARGREPRGVPLHRLPRAMPVEASRRRSAAAVRSYATEAAIAGHADVAAEASDAIAVGDAGMVAAAKRSVVERTDVGLMPAAPDVKRRILVIARHRHRDAGVGLHALVARRRIGDAFGMVEIRVDGLRRISRRACCRADGERRASDECERDASNAHLHPGDTNRTRAPRTKTAARRICGHAATSVLPARPRAARRAPCARARVCSCPVVSALVSPMRDARSKRRAVVGYGWAASNAVPQGRAISDATA